MSRLALILPSAALIILYLCASPSPAEAGAEEALHWSRPARATGEGGGVPFEEITPRICAGCHADKAADWSGSRHAASTGAGLVLQLDPSEDPEFAASCYRCHAPLIEQSEIVPDGEGGYSPNPSFDERLKDSGVSCAGCHLRAGAVYGPSGSKGPHGSGRRGLFSESVFCAACHQLEDGYELKGKVLMNTYKEWLESPYAKAGLPCQGCHMPDRRHLFRGIHSPETVLKGLTIEASGTGERAALAITNSGAGHYFPTYVTPQVIVRGFREKKGTPVEGTAKEAVIGRRVALDLDREEFDTRIPPKGTFRFSYEAPVEGKAAGGKTVIEIWVYPDEFYNRFFEEFLRENTEPEKVPAIKAALKETESGYLLYRREFWY